MNKHSKLAIQEFNSMSQKAQVFIFYKILKSKEFDDFNEDIRSKCSQYYIPFNYLTLVLSSRFEANTINGRRRASQQNFEDDKLKLIELWMPNGRFSTTSYGSFQPIEDKVQCTKLMLPYERKRRELHMIEEWNRIKSALLSKTFSIKNKFSKPRLDYEPFYNDSQDVYFLLDLQENIVKIGISKDIPKRIQLIKKNYNTGDLKLLSVIKSGGLAIEKRLHNHFSHIRLDRKDKGREWFRYSEELSSFIKELNFHPIKSRRIESLA